MSEILSKEDVGHTLNALAPWVIDTTGEVLTIPEWIAQSQRVFNSHEALRDEVERLRIPEDVLDTIDGALAGWYLGAGSMESAHLTRAEIERAKDWLDQT